MNTTKSFKTYNRNKFYNSIFVKTKELGFDPKYQPNEPDRTNFGNKLDWENKTKEVESLLSRDGLKVFLKDIYGNPISINNFPERPTGAPPAGPNSGQKEYRVKRILRSKNDVSLYTNIKNYYESNNKFFDFSRKSKPRKPPVYEIIEYFFTDLYLNIKLLSTKNVSTTHNSIVDINIDISSRKSKLSSIFSELDLNIYIDSVRECMIDGGKPGTNTFGYMLLGGDPNNANPLTLEQWCQINQP